MNRDGNGGSTKTRRHEGTEGGGKARFEIREWEGTAERFVIRR